jgi:hypothetical protein
MEQPWKTNAPSKGTKRNLLPRGIKNLQRHAGRSASCRLTLFFFAATFIQMAYLHWSILQYPAPDLRSAIGEELQANSTSFEEQMEYRRLEVLTGMESYLISRRYHQASVLLMSGLWIRYLGFITGMILALVGASFVLGKLREPATEVAGKATGIDFSLKSASPGIILVVLGTILMLTTILNQDVYQVQDAPMYLGSQTQLNSLDLSTHAPVPTIEDPERNIATPTPSPTMRAP